MKEIKFNAKEKEVFAIIEKEGSFNLTSHPQLKSTVMELWFKVMLERDMDKGITFIWHLTELGKKALEWNEAVKALN